MPSGSSFAGFHTGIFVGSTADVLTWPLNPTGVDEGTPELSIAPFFFFLLLFFIPFSLEF